MSKTQTTSESSLTQFEQYMLKKIARKAVSKGRHLDNIKYYYEVLNMEADREFFEDNKTTLNSTLTEIHQNSLSK